MHYYVIWDVFLPIYSGKCISCWYCSEAELTPNNSHISEKSTVCHKRCDFSWVRCPFQLKPYLKSSLLKTLLPFKLCKIISTVGIGCLSLSQPSDLGTTTTGLTRRVGPAIDSTMSKLISSWIFSSTFELRLKRVLRIGCATGFTFRSMWSSTARSFGFRTPLKTFGYFSGRISPMICEHVFTAGTPIPIFNTPISVAVSLLRSESPLPLIKQNSELVMFFPAETSHENVPITSKGVWNAYMKSYMFERADLHFTLFLFIHSHVCLSMISLLASESILTFSLLQFSLPFYLLL